jgi:cytochrome c peroxidase
MHSPHSRRLRVPFVCAAALATIAASAGIPSLASFRDPTGVISTLHTNGPLDTSGAFFQPLGTNGRTCASCHRTTDALSVSAAHARQMFAASHGTDPLFASVDGANCPGAAPDDAAAHSLMLGNGLVRIPLAMPDHAQFTITTVHDPYGCADTIDPSSGKRMISVYRRPLPATNLRFLSAVMFDGRDTNAPLNNPSTFYANLKQDLTHQALEATLGHAEASSVPSDVQLVDIVDFELNLYSAQSWDDGAGSLRGWGALGGPLPLAVQEYYPGINDSLGGNPTGAAFDPVVFSIFAPWADGGPNHHGRGPGFERRAAIVAGQTIFNTAPLTITNVAGLNDALGVDAIPGTCTTCHDAPNVGDHSLPVPLDIGVSHASALEPNPQIASALGELSMPDLPVFQVTCTTNGSVESVFTTDPARALITGKCADLTRGKGPILRGLAARAPYFHNGAAATLREVVEFYNLRFTMNLTEEQKANLTAFLEAL